MANTTSVTTPDNIKITANSNKTVTFPALTLPTGDSFTRFMITKTATLGLKIEVVATHAYLYFDTWYTDPSFIAWTQNGDTPKLKFVNDSSSYTVSSYYTITVESLTRVVQGEKILATDRSQTGTATTAGDVMTDTHWTAGTKITAADFNSTYIG